MPVWANLSKEDFYYEICDSFEIRIFIGKF